VDFDPNKLEGQQDAGRAAWPLIVLPVAIVFRTSLLTYLPAVSRPSTFPNT
jgi:hypothetical protein